MVEKIPVLNLEGYAINGFLDSFKIVDCDVKGKVRLSKIQARLVNGEEVETDCMEYPRAARIFVLLEKYKKFKNAIVVDTINEEMMKGITYDLDLKTSRKG
jgi:hypothetical protein